VTETIRKVALVGTAPSSKYAPVSDPSWQIWGVGARGEHITRADRWFELHRLDGESPSWARDWRELMKTWSQETPIWMFYPEPDLGPHIIQMDPKPLSEKFGAFFMTSSFSWMMAQAIEEGFTEIGLWGVDMEYGTEYRQQRVGLRHFIEVAKSKGITVRRLASSGISLEPIPYPFWQDDPICAKIKLRQGVLTENRKNAASVSSTMQEKITLNQGARDELAELVKIYSKDPGLDGAAMIARSRIERLTKDCESIRRGMQQARDDEKMLDGSLAELSWLEDYLQP
jgi:hypothetical protein